MAAPIFVAEYETTWTSSVDTVSTSVTTQVDDMLVILYGIHNGGASADIVSGGGLSYSLRATNAPSASYCTSQIWIARATANTSFTLSVSKVTSTALHGFNCLRFSNIDWVGGSGIGVGNNAVGNASGSVPNLTLTTTAANSAIAYLNLDWNGVAGARTYRTGPGTFTEQSYYQAATWSVHGGYYASAGTAGAKVIGETAPTGQKWNLTAVEILGGAGAAPQAVTANGAISLSGSSAAVGPQARGATGAVALAGSATASGVSTNTNDSTHYVYINGTWVPQEVSIFD